MDSMHILICFVSAPSAEVAQALSMLVVEQKLAACVNIMPNVRSVYRWKGEVTIDEEVLMVIKTSQARVSDLRDAILANHPYETPEFVVVQSIDASKAYADWVCASTAP
jgi:periplasmic divalent cation tolerance protein